MCFALPHIKHKGDTPSMDVYEGQSVNLLFVVTRLDSRTVSVTIPGD